MGSRKFKFALFGNIYQAKKSANIRDIMSYLTRRGAEVCVENFLRLSCKHRTTVARLR